MNDESGRKERGGTRRPPHESVRLWGLAVLVVGLLSAALIYVFAADDRDAEAAREMARGRMYEHNLEVMGGKLTVYLARFDDWFASLWQGRSLAVTVAVLAVAIALLCFWIAHLIATAPPLDESGRER